SLVARLDGRGPAKEVAQIGAAIGRQFSHALLAAVVRKPETELQSALDRLIQAGLLFRQGVPPSANYLFKHALVQDAAYGTLLRSRRQHLHGKIASTLEEAFPEIVEMQPAILARHCAEAGLDEKAQKYWRTAGEQAVRRASNREAIGHFRQALALNEKLPPDIGRSCTEHGLRQIAQLAESRDKQHRELVLQVALGRALIDHQGSGSEAVREAFERARELCLALYEVQLLPRIYDGLMLNYHFTHSQPQKMLDYAREMIAVHQRTNDRQALLMARRAGGLANLLL